MLKSLDIQSTRSDGQGQRENAEEIGQVNENLCHILEVFCCQEENTYQAAFGHVQRHQLSVYEPTVAGASMIHDDPLCSNGAKCMQASHIAVVLPSKTQR